MVTREAEFSDHDRIDLLGLARYRAGVHRCGYHRSIINDDDVTAHVARDECPFCAEIDRQNRIDQDAESKAYEKAHPSTPRPSDGRTTYIALGAPDPDTDEHDQPEGA